MHQVKRVKQVHERQTKYSSTVPSVGVGSVVFFDNSVSLVLSHAWAEWSAAIIQPWAMHETQLQETSLANFPQKKILILASFLNPPQPLSAPPRPIDHTLVLWQAGLELCIKHSFVPFGPWQADCRMLYKYFWMNQHKCFISGGPWLLATCDQNTGFHVWGPGPHIQAHPQLPATESPPQQSTDWKVKKDSILENMWMFSSFYLNVPCSFWLESTTKYWKRTPSFDFDPLVLLPKANERKQACVELHQHRPQIEIKTLNSGSALFSLSLAQHPGQHPDTAQSQTWSGAPWTAPCTAPWTAPWTAPSTAPWHRPRDPEHPGQHHWTAPWTTPWQTWSGAPCNSTLDSTLTPPNGKHDPEHPGQHPQQHPWQHPAQHSEQHPDVGQLANTMPPFEKLEPL